MILRGVALETNQQRLFLCKGGQRLKPEIRGLFMTRLPDNLDVLFGRAMARFTINLQAFVFCVVPPLPKVVACVDLAAMAILAI